MAKGKECNGIVLLLMFVLLSVSCIRNAEAVNVAIRDVNLEIVVRSALIKPAGNLTDQDLASLTELEAVDKGISDLSGLEYCINLNWLDLKNNRIIDLSALANLKHLKTLKLSYNEISDVEPLRKLTELEILELGYNEISDISPFINLASLTQLNLDNNQIDDITPLSNLVNMTSLGVSSNLIKDITPVSNLIKLSSLGISWNDVRDISPLTKLHNLSRLWAHDNPIMDTRLFAELTNLRTLNIGGIGMSDLSPLANLTNLKYLDLDNHKVIEDVGPLASLRNLIWLRLDRNRIRDIGPLGSLTNLTFLNLGRNQIRDISSLENLTNLSHLELWENQIIDIRPLLNLLNLTYLDLSKNQIAELDTIANHINLKELYFNDNYVDNTKFLENLTQLTKLGISNNKINDISSLARLTDLEELQANGNRISDISILSKLSKLALVKLNDNQVTDLQSLVDNPGINEGDTVEVKGNPLGHVSCRINIPELLARGVIVVFDIESCGSYIGISSITPQMSGKAFWVDIYAGVESFPMSDFFGISFRLNYTNTEIIDVVSPASENILAGDLLGSGVLFFSNVDDNRGQITISITRKAGAGGIDGFGTLARVCLIASSNIKAETSFSLTITDIEAQDPDGNRIFCRIPEKITVTIGPGGIIVWPGDTDNNGLVDERDVLPIGMYWAKKGPARAPASATWAPQTASTWTPSVATYADANGDGVVDERDVLPIGMNWHKTHEVPSGAPMLDTASIDHSQYIDAYRTLLTAFESSPKTEPVLRMAGLLREIIRQSIPKKTMVFQNYPNPFNPETWIPFQLAEDTEVEIAIYDASGALVRTMDLGYREAGVYTGKTRAAYWDGMNDSGENAASGVYFCRVQLGDLVTVKKIILAE